MRVLVTGGAGYVGSHTSKALALAGFEPIVFDNLVQGHEWAVRWGPFVRGDLADCNAIARTLVEYDVGAVIHFAASAYVGESIHFPRKYFQNNVTNTLHLLDAMLEYGVSRIIFSSTCATYGEPVRIPIKEDHPQCPVNPYGESKLFVEKVLRWYEAAYGMKWVTLRYFNAAGADPDGEIGEAHEPETHIIPIAVQAALDARSVEIYGSDYDTSDGTAVRDFVHVTDLADAHVKALQYLMGGRRSIALNLGSGTGSSVREIVAIVERVLGRTINVRYTGRRVGDPGILLAEASLAKSTLGWIPVHSSPEQIVESAWRWHRKQSTLRLSASPAL